MKSSEIEIRNNQGIIYPVRARVFEGKSVRFTGKFFVKPIDKTFEMFQEIICDGNDERIIKGVIIGITTKRIAVLTEDGRSFKMKFFNFLEFNG